MLQYSKELKKTTELVFIALLHTAREVDIYSRFDLHIRAVARSEIPGGLVVLGGDIVSPLVEIGLADLPNIGGAKAPQPPPCDGPVM